MAHRVPEMSSPSEPLYTFYEAATALRSCGIDCCIWCEGLMWHLNAQTVSFDYFFLVADPETAAQKLEPLGFQRLGLNPRYRFMTELLNNLVRLAHSSDIARNDKEDEELPAVVLLSATTWSFPINELSHMTDILPPVSLVACSLIDTWLNAETLGLRQLVRSYIAGTIKYVKETGIKDFEAQLQYQYQRDIWRTYKEGVLFGLERAEWLKRRQAEYDLRQSDSQKPDSR